MTAIAKKLLRPLLPTYRRASSIRSRHVFLAWLLFAALVIGLLAIVSPTVAVELEGVGGAIVSAVTSMMLWFATICIQVTIFLLRFFILVAGYNNYINAPVVLVGWNMVRDVANMFFVVILMAIAFGTILGLEQYEWRKTLVKLIIAALLVNFSNLILQLIIDVAQVFTVTFLNAIASVAGGNLIDIFNFQRIFELAVGPGQADQGSLRLAVFGAGVMALVFSVMAMGIMLAYVIIVLLRMVFLWVAIIMSPLVFVLSILPQTKSYADEFWKEFMNHVIAAPVMVFFLWLAFGTFGGGTLSHLEGTDGRGSHPVAGSAISTAVSIDGVSPAASFNKAARWDNMANFAVALAFLYVGVDRVKKLGVHGGGLAQGAVDFGKKVGAIASGYAAGRYLYEKGTGAAKKAAIGAAEAPFKMAGGYVGERIGRRVENVKADAAKWFYGKGYQLKQGGAELQQAKQEKEDILALAKSSQKRTALEEDIAGLQKARESAESPAEQAQIDKEITTRQSLLDQAKANTGEDNQEELQSDIDSMDKQLSNMAAGGVVGWLARREIQSQKTLAKTEKQAETRRNLLWKRTGSEAGSFLTNKGILKDAWNKKDQDRIERGWLQGEEMRSKAKDEEFETLGRKQVLMAPRIKFDVSAGKLRSEFKSGTMAERIAEHKLLAGHHDAAAKGIESEARLRLSQDGVKINRAYDVEGGVPGKKKGFDYTFSDVMAAKVESDIREQTASDREKEVMGKKRQEVVSDPANDLFSRFVKQKVLASFESEGALRLEEGVTDVAKYHERLKAGDADKTAKALEEEADRHAPNLNPVKAESARLQTDLDARKKELSQREKLLLKLEYGETFDRSSVEDVELLAHPMIGLQVDETTTAEQVADRVEQVRDAINLQEAYEQFGGDEEVFEQELKTHNKERNSLEAAAKAKDEEDPDVQRIRAEKRAQAKDTREKSAAWRHATALAKQEVASHLNLKTHQSLLSDAEQREVNDLRGVNAPNSSFTELAEIYGRKYADMPVQAYLGNLTNAAKIMNSRRIGKSSVHTELAVSLGFSKEHAKNEGFVRALVDKGVGELGLSHQQVFEGLSTGQFGARTEDMKAAASDLARKIGDPRVYDKIFEAAPADRQAFYDEFMKALEEKQDVIQREASQSGSLASTLYKRVNVGGGRQMYAPV